MEYKIQLARFQGPLDLLLQLIQNRELDISQVALAEVTDQYLAYLEGVENISATELADFLVVATKLLVIKSKSLLPQLSDDEEDSAEQLEAQLKMYKDYLDASRVIEKILGQNNILFSRERVAFNFEPIFSPPASLSVVDLAGIYAEVLNRIDYIVNLPQKIMSKVVTLKERVSGIMAMIDKFKKISFSKVITDAETKMEIVVSFMALLELIKSGQVAVNQRGIFDDIYVEKAS